MDQTGKARGGGSAAAGFIGTSSIKIGTQTAILGGSILAAPSGPLGSIAEWAGVAQSGVQHPIFS